MNYKSVKVRLASAAAYCTPGVEEFLRDEGAPEITKSIQSRAADKPILRARGNSADAFIRNLVKSEHGSVLKHVNFGVIIAGVSRSLTRELARHRAGFAHSRTARRRADSSADEFVVPPAMRGNAEARFNEATGRARDACAEVADILKAAQKASDSTKTAASKRKAARSVMPNATETKICVTGNIRARRRFLEMRGSEHADAEMRELAVAAHCLLSDRALPLSSTTPAWRPAKMARKASARATPKSERPRSSLKSLACEPNAPLGSAASFNKPCGPDSESYAETRRLMAEECGDSEPEYFPAPACSSVRRTRIASPEAAGNWRR